MYGLFVGDVIWELVSNRLYKCLIGNKLWKILQGSKIVGPSPVISFLDTRMHVGIANVGAPRATVLLYVPNPRFDWYKWFAPRARIAYYNLYIYKIMKS